MEILHLTLFKPFRELNFRGKNEFSRTFSNFSFSKNKKSGVSCDQCMKSNFSGKRYKCLICYDFDLCSACHDQSIQPVAVAATANKSASKSTPSVSSSSQPAKTVAGPPAHIPLTNNNHSSSHAMQCILTKSDFELFYGANILDFVEQSSFTCPYCGKLGFSETTLCEHISQNHANTSHSNAATTNYTIRDVVCPICAALPSGSGGDPNHLTDDLLQHRNIEHLNNGRSMDMESAASGGGEATNTQAWVMAIFLL